MNSLEKLPDRMTALESQIGQLRTEMRDGFSAIRRDVTNEIRSGDDETRTLMRVLHEDVISRIGLLQEGRAASKKHPKR